MKVEQSVTLTVPAKFTLGELRDFLDSVGGWGAESRVNITCGTYYNQFDAGTTYIEVEKCQ